MKKNTLPIWFDFIILLAIAGLYIVAYVLFIHEWRVTKAVASLFFAGVLMTLFYTAYLICFVIPSKKKGGSSKKRTRV